MRIRTVPAAGVPTSLRDLLKVLVRFLSGYRAFPKAGAASTGIPHCYPMWSGRSAMYIALRALHSLRPDKEEVLLPVLTCESVYYAVIKVGLKPVLYAVDPDTLGTSAAAAESKISGNTLCVVCSTLYGITIDMEAVSAIKRDHDVFLLEDTAQSMGGTWDGKKLGTFGDISVFSFGKSKNITTIHGGMVCTADEKIHQAMHDVYATLRSPGILENIQCAVLSIINYLVIKPIIFNIITLLNVPFVDTVFNVEFKVKKMGRYQMAMGLVMLGKLDELNSIRTANARKITDIIKSKIHVESLPKRFSEGSVYLRFPVLFSDNKKAHAALEILNNAGIWAGPLAYRPLYSITGENDNGYSTIKNIIGKILVLPSHPYLKTKDLERINKNL